MKFFISRTLSWDNKPCEEAYLEEHIYVDRRTVKTLKEAKLPEYKHWADAFFASGVNHREEDGMIARDLEAEPIWVIDINNLDELIRFSDKYGEITLGFEDNYKGIERSIDYRRVK